MKTILLILSLAISITAFTQNEYYVSAITDNEIEGGCALYLTDSEIVVYYDFKDGELVVNSEMKDVIVYYNEGLNCGLNPKYEGKSFYVLTKTVKAERYDLDTDTNVEVEEIHLVAIYIKE